MKVNNHNNNDNTYNYYPGKHEPQTNHKDTVDWS